MRNFEAKEHQLSLLVLIMKLIKAVNKIVFSRDKL